MGCSATEAIAREILRLEPLATYGPNMAQKVLDATARFDVAWAEIQAIVAELPPIAMEVEEPVDLGPNPHEEFSKEIAKQEEEKAAKLKEEEEERRKREREEAEFQEHFEAHELDISEQIAMEMRRIESMTEKQRLDKGFGDLLRLNYGTFLDVFHNLERLVEQCHSRPEIPKCLNLKNEQFIEEIGKHQGTIAFLRGLGFESREGHTIPPQEGMTIAPAETYLFMPEPDMFEKFDEWASWQDRLKEIAEKMRHMLSKLRGRNTHLADQLAARGVEAVGLSLTWN